MDDDESLPESENIDQHLIPNVNNIFSLFRDSLMQANDVSSDSNSSVDDDVQSDSDFPFPDEIQRALPCDHQYLGELEPVRGREIMDENSVQKIPLLSPGWPIMLVPGQIYPLVAYDQKCANIIKYAVEGNHILGILPTSFWNVKRLRGAIGTTAEIIAYNESDDGMLKIKAIGRQRFKVLQGVSELINEHYITFVYIRILPEVTMTPVLDGFILPSTNKFRSSQRLRCMQRNASLTRWPAWTYQYYDEKNLVGIVKKKLTRNCRISKNVKYSDDSNTLFFQLLKNFPLSQKLMISAMELNTPIQRLHWLIGVLEPRTDRLKCLTCETILGHCSDIFAMSAEGPHGTYVNSRGFVHELITLKKVKNVVNPAAECEIKFSWFPGYGWSILYCRSCQCHIGWKFTAMEEKLIPCEFWAFKNDAVTVSMKTEEKREMPFSGLIRRFRRPSLERTPRRRPRLSFH